MNIRQKICFVLLLTTFSSVFSGNCFVKPYNDVDDCRIQAKQGDVDAQFILGFMYANGKGVSQNDMEAVKWFKKAAEQGLYPVNALWAN